MDAAERANRRRQILRTFMESRELSVNGWCKRAKANEATLRGFLRGDTDGMNITTYEKLAAAEHVTVSMLIGEAPILSDEELRIAMQYRAAPEQTRRGIALLLAGDG
jgi:hypothetical protein